MRSVRQYFKEVYHGFYYLVRGWNWVENHKLYALWLCHFSTGLYLIALLFVVGPWLDRNYFPGFFLSDELIVGVGVVAFLITRGISNHSFFGIELKVDVSEVGAPELARMRRKAKFYAALAVGLFYAALFSIYFVYR